MKKLQLTIFVFLLFYLAGFTQVTIKKPIQKDKVVLSNKKISGYVKASQIKDIRPVHLQDIPIFDGVKPTNLIFNSNQRDFSNTGLYLPPATTVTISESDIRRANNVNGELNARNSYANSNAYLKIFNASLDPILNKIDCLCGNPTSFVVVNFRAEAGKRYLLTFNVSPKNLSTPARIGIFSDEFWQNFYVDQQNEVIDIVVRPASTGILEMWMQCSDPNREKTPWVFNNVEIQTVD